MLSGILLLAAMQGAAIWMPHKENTQGFPVTTEEKLRFSVNSVVMLVIIGTIAWVS